MLKLSRIAVAVGAVLALRAGRCFRRRWPPRTRSTSCRPRWCATCISATHSSITTRARTSRRSRACRRTAQWGRMPHHDAETDLLLGGLYLSLGLHNEAGERFETLLTQSVPEGVRNRAWFYLGKIWYARGYLDRAERAIKEVQGRLTPDLEAERLHLLSNILMRQQRFDEAIALLNNWKGRKDQSDWLAYAQYNLGVALVRKGLVTEADPFLTSVGTIESGRRELRSLRDRANLALGYAYLQNNQPALAKPVLERVRLDGPFSNKALLGVGWADAARRPVPGGAHAVDGAARPQPARLRRAGSLSRHSLRVRQAQRQCAGGRELRARHQVLRQRDGESRRVDRRDQRRHDARQAAQARRQRPLRLVLAAASEVPDARAVALPLSPAGRPRFPGRPEELSRPRVHGRHARASGRTASSPSTTCSTRANAPTPNACRRPTPCSHRGVSTNTARIARSPAASSTRSRAARTWPRSARPKSATSGRASCASKPRCSPRRTTMKPT